MGKFLTRNKGITKAGKGATGATGTVASVTGNTVDNTDPANPIIFSPDTYKAIIEVTVTELTPGSAALVSGVTYVMKTGAGGDDFSTSGTLITTGAVAAWNTMGTTFVANGTPPIAWTTNNLYKMEVTLNSVLVNDLTGMNIQPNCSAIGALAVTCIDIESSAQYTSNKTWIKDMSVTVGGITLIAKVLSTSIVRINRTATAPIPSGANKYMVQIEVYP